MGHDIKFMQLALEIDGLLCNVIQSDVAGANMKMTNQDVNARLRFNTLAQSPYPIRLNGMDVVKATFDEIVAESDDGKKTVYKRNEVGQPDRPQLNNLKCQFFINGKWI